MFSGGAVRAAPKLCISLPTSQILPQCYFTEPSSSPRRHFGYQRLQSHPPLERLQGTLQQTHLSGVPTRINVSQPSFSASPAGSIRHTQLARHSSLTESGLSPFPEELKVDPEIELRLRQLITSFKAPIRYAFAYGSGVFSQGGSNSSKPMIDLIFGVSHTQHWHSLNIAQNRSHYSFLASLGSRAVSYVQDSLGAGVYFNPFVDVNGTLIKYGVVNIDTLYTDLVEWNTLYLAGRLHKPVKVLRNDFQVRLPYDINLLSALRVALLLLPEKFTELELYNALAGISYLGDPRMSFAENPHKVSNIVSNQSSQFRELYGTHIRQLPNIEYLHGHSSKKDDLASTMMMQDMDPIRRGNMVKRLPNAFRQRLYFIYQSKFQIPRKEYEAMIMDESGETQPKLGGHFEQRIASDKENLHLEVGKAIKQTVAWPSSVQSAKGLLTAGPVKGWKYLLEKVGKWKKAKRT